MLGFLIGYLLEEMSNDGRTRTVPIELTDAVYLVDTSITRVEKLKFFITALMDDVVDTQDWHVSPYLTTSDKVTAYKLIVKNLINYFMKCQNLVEIDGISRINFKCKDIIENYLNANREYFKDEPVIPDEAIEEFYRDIKTFDNGFDIIKSLKQDNPKLFKLINKFNKDETDMASQMGELGF